MKPIQKKVLELIETNDCTSAENHKTRKIYETANPEVQRSIDAIFITLSGFSMKYILENLDNETKD